MAKKKAVKKAAPAPNAPSAAQPPLTAQPANVPTPEQLRDATRLELYRFLEWAASPDSDAFYSNRSQAGKDEFSRLQDLAYRTYYNLQNRALGEIADRATAHMSELTTAVGAIKRELDGQKNGAKLLADISSLLGVLVKILL